ncbi:GATA transcription factor [Striga asiatica]|uniref:GATA transcription factor n=1 Tax=Striga asiatica TaxID=4170 RepID=A0A5A7QEC6_STRAF|nr:GATA transcription factor [Striga asiatica]
MECIEARALKSSFLAQMAVKTNPQMFQNDDVWCLTKINSVAADDFPVEDLLNLDLPEKDFQEGFCFSQEDNQFPQKELSNNSSSSFTGADEIDSLSELAVPVDDLESLEWLSQFVDDSSSGLSLLCPAGSFQTGANSGKRPEPASRPARKNRAPRFPVPIPGKPRTTRSRKPSGRPWTLSPPPLSPAGSTSLCPVEPVNPVWATERLFGLGLEKLVARKRKAEPEGGLGRKCTHCQVQKTPQWRSGPLGPKTLCNACGVRYKSGRLFPEYRPAFSPTFSNELHSNSHRKVLEMRRRKEISLEQSS